MKQRIRTTAILAAILVAEILGITHPCQAGWLHATPKAAAERILARGIKASRFSANARFGKGFYAAAKRATAQAEKGAGTSLIRIEQSNYAKNNVWRLRQPTAARLRSLLGPKVDLRGSVKKGVVGPKIGRRLGQMAGRQGKVIHYRSVKDGGTNLFVPRKLFETHPGIVKAAKIGR